MLRPTELVSPGEVIKQAFAAELIRDGQVWIDMLNHRNLLSHRCDSTLVDDALEKLATDYRPAMDELHETLPTDETAPLTEKEREVIRWMVWMKGQLCASRPLIPALGH
jgi:uncharacterized protein YfaA (DUF2138 family)